MKLLKKLYNGRGRSARTRSNHSNHKNIFELQPLERRVLMSADVTVDNPAATLVGSWSSSTYDAGFYGSNYVGDGNAGKGTKSATFATAVTEAGAYDAYAYYPGGGTGRSTNTPFDLMKNGTVLSTASVNQSVGGGSWVWLGQQAYAAGDTAAVRVRNAGTTGSVLADAVRLVRDDGIAPTVPGALRVTPANDRSIDVLWQPAPAGELVSGYEVWRQAPWQSSPTLLATLDATRLEYFDAALAQTTGGTAHTGTFQYQVYAVQGGGAAGRSGAATGSAARLADGAQRPYGGVRWAVPGTVQAEDYDTGGQNVSYLDSNDVNTGGRYRAGGPDLTTYGGGGGYDPGYAVNYWQTTEWTEYAVTVTEAGTYRFEAAVASAGNAAGGTFQVYVDGTVPSALSSIAVPNTNYGMAVVSAEGFTLGGGDHTLKIRGVTSGANNKVGALGWFRLTRTDLPDAAPTNLTATATSATTVDLANDATGTAAAPRQVTVANIAPVAAIGGAPATWQGGQSYPLTAAATDAGAADGPFTYAWSLSVDGGTPTTHAGNTFDVPTGVAGVYVVALVATDKDGAGSVADARSFTIAPPATPTGLTATAVSSSQVDLAWTDAATNETGYALDRATSADFTTGLVPGTLPANAASYSATGLAAGTTYYFRVRAVKGTLPSADSNAATATTAAAPTEPDAPTILYADAVSATQVDLYWDDLATDETGYVLQRRIGTGTYSALQTLVPDVTEWSDESVTAGTTYQYRVKATGSPADSAWVESEPVTPMPDLPAEPMDVVVVRGTGSDVVVSWSAGTDADGHDVTIEELGTTNKQTFSLASNVISKTFTNLTPGRPHEVTLSARNASGTSALMTPPPVTTAPSLTVAPATGQQPVVEGGSFSVTMDAALYAVRKWLVDWGDGVEQVVAPATGGPTTSAAHTYADDGAYSVKVKVEDEDGETKASPLSTSIGTVDPTVSMSGKTSALTNSAYMLYLNAADAGIDRVTSWTVDWGDGATSVVGDVWSAAHVYKYGRQNHLVSATATNSDGTFAATVSRPGHTGDPHLMPVSTTPTVLAPSSLVPTVKNASTIWLNWVDNSDNEQGFKIEKSTDGQTFQLVDAVSSNTTSFKLEGLEPETQYYVRVRAYKGPESSDPATTYPVTTPAGRVPNIPTNFQVVSDGSGTHFSCTTDADQIWVQIRSPLTGDAGEAPWSSLGISGEHQFTPTRDYQAWWPSGTEFRVRGVNLAVPSGTLTPHDFSAWSEPVTAIGSGTTLSPPPPTVSGLAVTLISPTLGMLSWQRPASWVNGSYMWDTFGTYAWGGPINFGSEQTSGTTVYRYFSFRNDLDYSFSVNVSRSYVVYQIQSVRSAPIEVVNIHTPKAVAPPTQPPGAPSELQARPNRELNAIELAWEDNSDNESGFVLERRTGGGNWSVLSSPGANTTTYADSDVAIETGYEYRLLAHNESASNAYGTGTGNSNYSNAAGATIVLPTVQFAGSIDGFERKGDPAQLRLTRSGGNLFSPLAVSLAFLSPDSDHTLRAKPGSDYTSLAFAFAPGQLETFVKLLPTVDDNLNEVQEFADAKLIEAFYHSDVNGVSPTASATIGDHVQLVAHRTGDKLGEEVLSTDEDRAERFVVLTNNDFDEKKVAEPDYANRTSALGEDDDLVQLDMRKVEPMTVGGEVTLGLEDPQRVRLFKASGALLYEYRSATDPLYDPAVNSLDVLQGTKDGSTYLSALASGGVTVWLEALSADTDYAVTLSYADTARNLSDSDAIHMRLVEVDMSAASNLLTGGGDTGEGEPDGIPRSAKFRFDVSGLSPSQDRPRIVLKESPANSRKARYVTDSLGATAGHFDVYYAKADALPLATGGNAADGDWAVRIRPKQFELIEAKVALVKDRFTRKVEGATKPEFYDLFYHNGAEYSPAGDGTLADASLDQNDIESLKFPATDPTAVFPGNSKEDELGRQMLVNFRATTGSFGELLLHAFLNTRDEDDNSLNNRMSFFNFKLASRIFGDHLDVKEFENPDGVPSGREIVIDSNLTPSDAANELYKGLVKVFTPGFFSLDFQSTFVKTIKADLLDALNDPSADAGAIYTQYQSFTQGLLVEVAKTAEELTKFYYKSIAMVGEGANLVVAIHDLAQGDPLALVNLVPFLGKAFASTSFGAGTAFKVQMYGGEALASLDAAACRLLAKGGCFLPGTLVWTESGQRAIEDVRAGERVWAWDEQANAWRLSQVIEPFSLDYAGTIVTVAVGGETIAMTGEHPVWVVSGDDLAARPQSMSNPGEGAGAGRWVMAKDLRTGDVLRTVDGSAAAVEQVEASYQQVQVHNLTIEGDHTFAVGAAGVLVHNACTAQQFADVKAYWKAGLLIAEEADEGITKFRVNGRSLINSNKAFEAGGYVDATFKNASGLTETVRVDFLNGFPEFTPFLYGGGASKQSIVYTGTRASDAALCNKLAGFAETPEGYTWHHHQDLGKMVLVRADVHDAVRHTGGVAIYKAGMRKWYGDQGLPVPTMYND